ncbi:MAG: thiosulfate oxidation carrier protein SoxY [Burkholderiales bacterium]|nr:thiosulfate oxidation carrier protein SoxY [Burkholderiales bacterium]
MRTSFQRRRLLGLAAASPLFWLASALKPVAAWAADWPKSLFDMPTSDGALALLGAQAAQAGKHVLLDAPEIVDRDDRVTVRVYSAIPATEQITILVDKALRPVVAQFVLTAEAEPDVSVTIKLPSTSTVRAVVKAGGKLYTVTKEIKLAMEPCDAPAAGTKPQKPAKGRPA